MDANADRKLGIIRKVTSKTDYLLTAQFKKAKKSTGWIPEYRIGYYIVSRVHTLPVGKSGPVPSMHLYLTDNWWCDTSS